MGTFCLPGACFHEDGLFSFILVLQGLTSCLPAPVIIQITRYHCLPGVARLTRKNAIQLCQGRRAKLIVYKNLLSRGSLVFVASWHGKAKRSVYQAPVVMRMACFSSVLAQTLGVVT